MGVEAGTDEANAEGLEHGVEDSEWTGEAGQPVRRPFALVYIRA
jgi:hypothetical protein